MKKRKEEVEGGAGTRERACSGRDWETEDRKSEQLSWDALLERRRTKEDFEDLFLVCFEDYSLPQIHFPQEYMREIVKFF